MKMQYPMGFVSAAGAPVPGKTLAMAYIVKQEWRSLYEVEKGFREGTIFKELNFPYMGRVGGGGAHV